MYTLHDVQKRPTIEFEYEDGDSDPDYDTFVRMAQIFSFLMCIM